MCTCIRTRGRRLRSKFGIDRWGAYTAQVSKKAGGKPVRVMLERDAELILAGCRPSAFAKVKVAQKKMERSPRGNPTLGTGGPAEAALRRCLMS